MHKPLYLKELFLSLKIRGYNVVTAEEVFVLMRALDANLERSLEASGYVQRPNILLSDGQIVDGWVKI